MRCDVHTRAETDLSIKIVQSTVLGSCYPSGITTINESFLSDRALRLGSTSTVNDGCWNKDQIASGWLGLGHMVLVFHFASVTLRRLSGSIPDVSTVDDRPFCFLPCASILPATSLRRLLV